ncbi:uncharacterized protein LOC110434747 [Sorghum bicolor]|uniref:uncharacterized protein LOC110434747 n=1 Tax=Sorghum bicolor TaxID=4558 RepID=UPI000B4239C1|nr:uncharacterized protein LOC110434747 [Sorghum bicolor]|eukprot:XP_021315137.1 uncharacterized protein LOC110434747 [Sorghum bicolor]
MRRDARGPWPAWPRGGAGVAGSTARAVDRGAAVVHRSMVDRGQGRERRGPGPWWTGRGRRAAVHGGPRAGRGEQDHGGAAGRDGGAMAAAGEVAGTALRGETEHAEGTTGVGTTQRGRGAAHLRETGSAERSATAAAARLTASARVSVKRTRGGSGAKLGF